MPKNPAQDGKKMDIDNEKDSDSDSDSSSMSGDDDEEETDETLALLELRLKSCEGRDYDAHAELVRILRDKNMMKKLEKAREAFSQTFPLTDELWLEWIGDEARLAITDEDQDGLSSLYERALADYCTTGLWMAYISHFQNQYAACDTGSARKQDLLKRTRDIISRSLARMGTDFDKGHQLWEESRKLELLVLEELGKSKADASSVAAQRDRIRQAFQGQLSVPGRHLDEVLEAYKAWEDKAECVEETQAKFEGAKTAAEERAQKETAISTAPQDGVLQAWLDYICMETEKGDADRIKCLYERALLPCCLAPSLWHNFLEFLSNQPNPTPQSRKEIQATYKRAVRNCPYSAELWCGYSSAIEKALQQGEGGKEGEIETVLNKAVASVRHYNAAALPQVLRLRCEFLRRRWARAMGAGKTGESEAAAMRQAFEEAATAMAQEGGDLLGAKALQLQWGDVEALQLQNVDKAVEVWDDALKGWKDLAGWSHVTDMLRALRMVGQARACYKRGCNTLDGEASLPAFVLRWVDFERMEGDVLSLELATERYRLASASAAPAVVAVGEKVGRAPRKKDKTDEDPEKAKRREEVMKKWAERKAAKEEKKGKRKREEPEGEAEGEGAPGGEPTAEKRQKVETGPQVGPEEGKKSVFVQNIGPDASEMDVRGIFIGIEELKGVRVVRDKHGNSKGFAYVDLGSEEAVELALKRDGTSIKGRMVEVSRSRPLHAHVQQAGIDAKTLYVSGLAPTVTRETVRELFAKSGQVDDVRMMRDREGKLRGFCYVQFADDQGAKAGLEVNGQDLEGRKLRVALSDPSRRQAPQTHAPAGQAPASRGRGGKSMLALVPRAINRSGGGNKPPPKRAAFAGAHKKDGGNGAAAAAGGGGETKEGGAPEASSGTGEQGAKKDNNFFRNLFSKGDNL